MTILLIMTIITNMITMMIMIPFIYPPNSPLTAPYQPLKAVQAAKKETALMVRRSAIRAPAPGTSRSGCYRGRCSGQR